MLRKRLGLLAVATVWACHPVAKTDPVQARNAIESLNTKVTAWYNAGQADSVASIFAQDAWQMPPNMPPLVGRDSIRGFWTNALKTGKWHFDLKTDDVAASDSVAAERGHYSLRVTAGPQAQYPSFEDHGNYIVLWRKEGDGHWRIVWDAPVSTVPMPMPAKAPPAPPKKR